MPNPWSQIKISIEYGYFASMRPVSITCYSDGDLHFQAGPGMFDIDPKVLTDSGTIRRSSIQKLHKLIQQIEEMTSLETEGFICDGPSFECTVTFKNGIIKGFGYVAEVLPQKYKQLEKDIRKTLREQYFFKKHEKSFFPL